MNKWKISSPPVAPAKGRRKKDIIESSPNSRAACQHCQQKISKGTTRIGIQGKIETPQGIQVYRLHYYHDNCVTEETKRKLHTAPSSSKQPPKKKAKKDTNCNTSTSNAKKKSAAKQTSTNPSPTRQLKPKIRKQLEKDLRQLRTCYATAQGNCEEYKIFSNKSLTELLTKLPTTNEELSECWGIKGKRIKQYGKSILQIIDAYLDKEQEQQGGRGSNGRRRVQTTIPTSPPSTTRRTSATANNSTSSTRASSVSTSSTAVASSSAVAVTPAKESKTLVKKEEDTSDDEDIVIVGPTLSVEEIVRRNVREAEARGEVLEIL